MIKANNDSICAAVPCQAVIGGYMIRVLLCDDNAPFLEALRSEIRRILKAHKIEGVIHMYSCVEEIPEHLLSDCDIYFLDIDFERKQYTGIDLAKRIRENNSDAIIVFATNFIEYAPEGYEVQAFRYLLKRDIQSKLKECLLQTISKLQTDRESIQINISGEILTIPLVDILYIESQGHLALIHVLRKGSQMSKTYRFYSSLANLEEQLSTQGFLRIQKSYLVNMRRITKYQCNEARLDNGQTLRVSEKNYSENKKQYLLWKGRR